MEPQYQWLFSCEVDNLVMNLFTRLSLIDVQSVQAQL